MEMINNKIDTLAMKRQIQEQIADATCDMTPEALLAYFHQRIATSRFATFIETTPTVSPPLDRPVGLSR